ncbi:MAG: anti-anti-sigma factor, partial [Nannocystaceae bacterium]
MIVEFAHLAACKRGLTLSAAPAWVFDAETIDFLWANELAVKLWRAESEAALLARDVTAGAPERVLTRTRHLVERVRRGEVVQQEWTFYPGGKPTVVSLNLRGVLLDNGKLGVLNQALPVAGIPDSLLRVSAVVRHSAVIATLVSPEGRFLSQNPAADRA